MLWHNILIYVNLAMDLWLDPKMYRVDKWCCDVGTQQEYTMSTLKTAPCWSTLKAGTNDTMNGWPWIVMTFDMWPDTQRGQRRNRNVFRRKYVYNLPRSWICVVIMFFSTVSPRVPVLHGMRARFELVTMVTNSVMNWSWYCCLIHVCCNISWTCGKDLLKWSQVSVPFHPLGVTRVAQINRFYVINDHLDCLKRYI